MATSVALPGSVATGVTAGMAGPSQQVCNVFVRDVALARTFPMHHFGRSFSPLVAIRVRGAATAGADCSSSTAPGLFKTSHQSATEIGAPLVYNHQFNDIAVAPGADALEITIFSARTLAADTHVATGLLMLSDLNDAANRGYALDRWVPLSISNSLTQAIAGSSTSSSTTSGTAAGGALPLTQPGQAVAFAHVVVSLKTQPPAAVLTGLAGTQYAGATTGAPSTTGYTAGGQKVMMTDTAATGSTGMGMPATTGYGTRL